MAEIINWLRPTGFYSVEMGEYGEIYESRTFLNYDLARRQFITMVKHHYLEGDDKEAWIKANINVSGKLKGSKYYAKLEKEIEKEWEETRKGIENIPIPTSTEMRMDRKEAHSQGIPVHSHYEEISFWYRYFDTKVQKHDD